MREGTWDQLLLHPTTLMRTVIEGIFIGIMIGA